ncbi:hypothetical protein FNAPI_7736 [Fusarium napiforme]|uniref:Secreted protein n=1 Tax=Fusarium napiforme TaxID=42672 RepID=A0A8H5N1S0_9HYPO|nr:hypothetical protein FNAPI_7736 [Fusarium napiforme]
MEYKSILCLIASISLIQGFVVPEGLKNGIYSVNKDKNGNEQIEYVSGFEHSTKSKHRRVPLPSGEIGCTGAGLDYSDLSGAQVQLYNYCGSSATMPSKLMVFVHGTAKAYICNYADAGKNTCADHEAKAAFASLSGNCGNPSSPLGGWYFLKDWQKTYGYDAAGADVCGNL